MIDCVACGGPWCCVVFAGENCPGGASGAGAWIEGCGAVPAVNGGVVCGSGKACC